MQKLTAATFGAIAMAFLAVGSYAQESSPANKEYMAAMEKMEKKMKEASDADPSKSFAKKMVAHHEGALEMGSIVQKYTKDDQMKKMAAKMGEEQKKDIKELKEWLSKN